MEFYIPQLLNYLVFHEEMLNVYILNNLHIRKTLVNSYSNHVLPTNTLHTMFIGHFIQLVRLS